MRLALTQSKSLDYDCHSEIDNSAGAQLIPMLRAKVSASRDSFKSITKYCELFGNQIFHIASYNIQHTTYKWYWNKEKVEEWWIWRNWPTTKVAISSVARDKVSEFLRMFLNHIEKNCFDHYTILTYILHYITSSNGQ